METQLMRVPYVNLPFVTAAVWVVFTSSLFAGNARQAIVHRLQEDIKLDGILNESVWLNTPSIGNLIQREPNEGETPSEQTQVRVAYNKDAIYVAVYCFDSSPESIVATHMRRDAHLFSDDSIAILFDTFHDQRNAYYFQTNPLGVLVDARITENRSFDRYWDGIWMVKSRILSNGWTAEFMIPFKTLSFRPDSDTWGFNVSRNLARTHENSVWASPSLDVRFQQVAMAGAISGLQGQTQGIGIDIKPFGLLGHNWGIEAEDRVQHSADAGLDIFYRVTNNLLSSTTFNTDFAETEVDTTQINLTRFPLLFPEQRDFFREDAGVFSFGIGSTGRWPGYGGGSRADVIPFFSRKIGLVDGIPIPIVFGQKLTGKMGRFDVGLLDIVTGDSDELSGQNFFVARTKANFWNESYVGALVTHGEPTGATRNNFVGVDMRLATSNFLSSKKNFNISLYGSKTQTPDLVGKDQAYGLQLSYPNDFFRSSFELQQIGENYNPALGFVRRNDIRKSSFAASVNPRPKQWNIRQMSFGVRFSQYSRLSYQQLESRSVSFTPLEFEFDSGARLQYRVRSQFERLFEPFDIRDDLSIPADTYSFLTQNLSFRSAINKPWNFNVMWNFGAFYNGNRDKLSTRFNWRNKNISTSLYWQQDWVHLKQGDFSTQLARFRYDYSFSPLLSLTNFIQYDTDSHNLGLQSKLRWIIQPGNEIFFVFNHNWQRDLLDRFEFINADVRAKIHYTVRF